MSNLNERVEQLGTWWGQRIFDLARQIQSGDTSEADRRWGNREDYDSVYALAEEIAGQGEDLSDTDSIRRALGMANVSSNASQSDTQQEPALTPLASGFNVGDVVGAEEGLGRYGEGFVVTEDGMFHNISQDALEAMRAKGVTPAGVNPSLLSPVERVRMAQMGTVPSAFNEYIDQTTGNKFVLQDGGLFTTSAVPSQGTPTFIGNQDPGGAAVGTSINDTTQPAPTTASVGQGGADVSSDPFSATQVTLVTVGLVALAALGYLWLS